MSYLKVETLEIGGLHSVLTALHLPFGGEVKSDTTCYLDFSENRLDVRSYNIISEHDMKLMSTLVKRGDNHAKPLRGLLVWAMIDAPIHFWWDLETHRYGRERLFSASTQNDECKGLSGKELLNVKDKIPFGRQVKKVDCFSYQSLRNIYKQRKNHRNHQFKEFCDWIETLPFSSELIIK